MDLRTRLLFNVEVLHLKAMFEGNTSQTANDYQQVLSYLTNNNVTTAFQMQDIPAGKKTRSIIRYIIENRRKTECEKIGADCASLLPQAMQYMRR